MIDGKRPDPDKVHPIAGYENEIYVKPTISDPNIEVGEFTYIADAEFESHVTHHYPWLGDKLIIGKYCQIAAGVEFMMNGANHQLNAVSTYPFFTLEGWDMAPPERADLPFKGDTVVGNDVWIGQNALILPGVHIGDGAIIGAGSVVGSDVAPYTIVAGDPARPIRKRFDDELIALLLQFKWWDKSIDEVNTLIPLLTSSDLEKVRKELKALNNTGITYRREQEADHRAVEELIRESFWNVYRPGCSEHYVIHVLRDDPAFVPELDFVMELDGRLIGQNMFMRTVIDADDGRTINVLTMGPICITPELKRKGYGKQLLDYSLEQAAAMGFGAVLFEGNIAFYGNCGFDYASRFGIRYHDLPEDADASFFLCKELIPGYLDGITGVYQTPQGYYVDDADVEEFDKSFPPKIKLKLPGQLF